jgi:predicted DNA-binding protein (UPF0251 family)
MIDPTEIETRFSNEDSMSTLDSIFTEPSDEDLEKISRVKEIMEELPPREADFIELYYFQKLKQTDIATIFSVSQPTVCYRLQRATSRIQFILELPDVNPEDLKQDLKSFLDDPLDVKIMILMFETTCQSEVAKRLEVSQGLVRHRFIRSIRKMEQDEKMAAYGRLFDTIASNLNILREVQRNPTPDHISYTVH